MNAIVFLGPTLDRDAAQEILDADYRPPASQGDVYRAALCEPRAIGIVDGYFERLPAVWHKEILWAMTRGIHVFGSASMGALRAAELEAFGMEGVGRVFERFRDGELEDDDEVAVIHGPPESGYIPLSDAMVNIRATLERAEREGVIDAGARRRLCRIAKESGYRDRSLDTLSEHVAPDAAGPLREWMVTGRVDVKREDARKMLSVMRDRLDGGLGPKRVSFDFEETSWWQVLRAMAGDVGPDAAIEEERRVLDELRRDGKAWARIAREALLLHLAVERARGRVDRPDARDVLVVAERFCRERDLATPGETQAWRAREEIGEFAFDRRLEEEALLARLEDLCGPEIERRVLDLLRWRGEYGEIARRVRR